MADYNGIEALLNTVEGMECIVNNVGHDDDTVSCAGVDWFKFNNVSCSTMYANGDCWIGIGTNAEQLKVCSRDGKMWYLYLQEGTILGYLKFYKLRWQGYTHYGKTGSSYALIFELFLFEDGRMFLNVVQSPTNNSYLGTSALVCGSNTYPLTIGTNDSCPIYYTFTPTDESGTAWTVLNEIIVIQNPYKYLIRSAETLYTVQDGGLVALEEITPTAALFTEYGIDSAPESDILKTLVNPAVLCWTDGESQPTLTATVTGYPFTQTLETLVDLSSDTITAISSITANYLGNIGVLYSVDGKSTWTEEQTISDFLNTDLSALLGSLQETRQLFLQFVIYADSKLTEFQIKYKN